MSVDQQESSQVGFFAHLKGRLTSKRYTATTIFVDHCSELKYIHFMTAVTSEETLYAKECFECFCHQNNVLVEHYHCDDGCFAEKAFIDNVTKKGQTISNCAAYAHFQNGKAEKAIWDMQDMIPTMLLHAKAR